VPLSPTLSTGLQGSDAGNPTLSTGAAKLSATLTGVTSGHAVIVVTHAYKPSTASGDLVTGVTIGGSAATLAVRRVESNTGNLHRTETCVWYALNQTAGNKAIVLSVNGPLYVNWHADSWAIATASAIDKTASAWAQGAGSTFAVPGAGDTGTLAQSTELVIAAVTDKYQWGLNSGYSDPGIAPSGYTALAGNVADNLNRVGCQTAYRETNSTAGVSASWALAQTGGDVTGVIATFKIATVQRRVKVLADSAMNGATGITAYAWSGDPSTSFATKWTGLSAQPSGGIVYLASPPSGWATGSDVNVVLYQPAGTKKGTSFVLGRVEEY
jgi:hypothetical protein